MSTTMACKNCGANMDKHGICPSCDWRVGWMPIAQHSGGGTTFTIEPRHKFIAAGIFLAVAIGIIAFVAGIASGAGGGALLGIIIAVAAILAWNKTHFGRVWTGLPGDDKAVALPGVIIGVGLAIILIPLTLLCLGLLSLARLDL